MQNNSNSKARTLASNLTVVVIGAGAWGTTLAKLADAGGHEVRLWSRRSGDRLQPLLEGADIVVSAVSMKGVRTTVEQVRQAGVAPHTIFVTATKGLDPDSGSPEQLPLLPSQLWQTAFPAHPVVVLSGPNLSKEIQQGLPAATVVASQDIPSAEIVQLALSSPSFRIYTNPDILGVELGGTLKNVIAIAVGTCDGLQLGTNAKAALVTRGLAEIIRVGTCWGARPETFYGLAGLGDLLATCNSPLSRNYQVGYGLAQGKSLEQVLAQLEGTAEGINTTQVLVKLASQQGIPVPISHQVDRLLQNKITPQAAVEALMLRDYKPEMEEREVES
ncbi:NAD(P)H-dependent glycerol-3-phosphate dehydrogenase [Leptothermofonsia sichuanensis E412]|uniref:NAD(P)H-dependent glycerol-3-phosphate dehydrogenase n=1 Tax=Leptothermofonsia sichuanensis TaxID=2917832 RepID=UPI001CA78E64|nr:NAD(P)H-dependent glycerol-3-phosphate dehydrogenase [Leptothermofonsia sichuanensis]QZZ20012.1 NAD(P)H-dependent glycerol-3-phosphate dehydrogenase [Leptothermofonsia sichuanensis E412]